MAKAFETLVQHGGLMGLGRDGHAILIADTRRTVDALRELQPEGGDWGPRFAEQDDQDLIFDPATERLIGTQCWSATPIATRSSTPPTRPSGTPSPRPTPARG